MSQPAPALVDWLRDYNQWIAELERQGFQPTPQHARDGLARLTAELVTRPVDVDSIIDTSLLAEDYAIPLRIYRPRAAAVLPVLVYLHGGGHMSGSIDVYDPICRRLASYCAHIVVAIEYRLAPEFPYPAGMEDAERVLRHIGQLLDDHGIERPPRLALAGDSGGGAMTASIVHRDRGDAAIPVDRQVLIYPSLDYTLTRDSIRSNGRGYLLHEDRIAWYFDHYFQGGEDRRQLSPLYMPWYRDLPRTLVVSAQFCPLRDEALAYVERLREAGVDVRHEHFDDMIHAFVNMEDLVARQCLRLYRVIGEFLNE